MDLQTVMLMLAIGSFLFAILLVVLKIRRNEPKELTYWIIAKFLQGTGSLLLYFKTNDYDFVTVIANITLLLGCANEAWVIRILSGQSLKSWVKHATYTGIILLCILTLFLRYTNQNGLVFLLQSIFYFLPGVFLYVKSNFKSYLKTVLSASYFVTGIVFFTYSFVWFVFPNFIARSVSILTSIVSIISFSIFLVSGIILLMLSKERSDMLIKEIKKSLEKSEIRFKRIVETSIEGILIFDEDYKIIFANKTIAKKLGYSEKELQGKLYVSLFPKDSLEIFYTQESLRKKKEESVYECRLLRKDSKHNWFLISENTMTGEDGRYEGSFAMLTDINDRKEMEILLKESNKRLEELSNTDGLTGIANRRRFDEILEREYSRLNRLKSKLSIILLDIDYFKEYNDYYGHVMGDECLRKVSKILSECVSRSVDLVARYGGEEFACILPDTKLQYAVKIAEEIQEKIRNLSIEHKNSMASDVVTLSIGVLTVSYISDYSPTDIVNKADELLYQAKGANRNCIKYAEIDDAKII